MARKKKTAPVEEIVYAPVTEQLITDSVEKNYMPYAMSVIISRAIPAIDGFKPAHRKLLYTMYSMGLLNGKLTKSANIVGQTIRSPQKTANRPSDEPSLSASRIGVCLGGRKRPSETPIVASRSSVWR